ncbi:MAG: hypothetical protein L6R41_005797 [Letrouitia leprolyta]|nr:MAG: hypothetical protein L6R41_005797 [Letrouitia leprolyta]
MMYFGSKAQLGLFTILFTAPFAVIAQSSTALDPTDLSNWPLCAQKCIPRGFPPPANCGSLSNLDCVCKGSAFTLAIADCEQSTCLLEEREQILKLTDALCAPVGGTGPAVSQAAASFFATYTLQLPSAPTLVAPTPAPNLGNVSDLNNYPPCDIACAKEARRTITSCDTRDKNCICGPVFRSTTAACVELNCDIEDVIRTEDLDKQFCGPLYLNNATLSSAVASAIESATKSVHDNVAAAAAATATAGPVSYNNNGTNTTVTGALGGPTPAAFTGSTAAVNKMGAAYGMIALTGITVMMGIAAMCF